MKYDAEIDDELLQNILYRTESLNQSAADSDDADELFALMIEKGRLEGQDRELFFRCLDADPMLRRSVGLYVQQPAAAMAEIVATEPRQPASVPSSLRQRIAAGMDGLRRLSTRLPWAQGSSMPQSRQSRATGVRGMSAAWAVPYFPQAAMACAALLLVATTAVLWFAGQPTAHLSSLAMRGGLNLIDIGCEPDEIKTMGGNDQPALDLQPMLDTVRDPDEREQLKIGYSLLQRNKFPQAGEAFQKVIGHHPQSYYAHLGRGIAYYMEGSEQLANAEKEFDEAVKLLEQQQVNTQADPRALAVRINRAITLTKRNHGKDALAEWQIVEKLASDHLPQEQRDAIEGWKQRAVDQLDK